MRERIDHGHALLKADRVKERMEVVPDLREVAVEGMREVIGRHYEVAVEGMREVAVA